MFCQQSHLFTEASYMFLFFLFFHITTIVYYSALLSGVKTKGIKSFI